MLAAYVLGTSVPVGLDAQSTPETTLPILHVGLAHEDIPDEERELTTLRIVDGGPGALNRFDDPGATLALDATIEVRGSTSATVFPKTGYGFELKGRDGADTSVALLGMPREEDWVLHGPYSDKTLVRNAFAYSLAGALMDYAPRTRFVELVAGGDYRGVYLLTERIKRDGDRVDIARLEPTDTTGDALTGGYILKVDKNTGEDFRDRPAFWLPIHGYPFGGQSRTQLLYHYPKPERVHASQRAYIRGWLTEFERRLASPEFDDPERGYLPLVDLASFVDYFLVNEVTRNVDAFRLSTYFYKSRDSDGGRLHMGPVWDFNLALANANYCFAEQVEGWVYRHPDYCPDDYFQPPFWYARLFESVHFRTALVARFADLRTRGPLGTAALDARLDSLVGLVAGPPAARNFVRWPILDEHTWPNTFVPGTHERAVQHARTYLHQRVAWIERELARLVDADGATLPTRVRPRLYPTYAPAGSRLTVAGVGVADYPLQVEWMDLAGRSLGASTVLRAGVSPEAPQARGLLVYRITTASGQRAVGRFTAID